MAPFRYPHDVAAEGPHSATPKIDADRLHGVLSGAGTNFDSFLSHTISHVVTIISRRPAEKNLMKANVLIDRDFTIGRTDLVCLVLLSNIWADASMVASTSPAIGAQTKEVFGRTCCRW